MANDGGNLLLSDDEKKSLLKAEPESGKYIQRFTGSQELCDSRSISMCQFSGHQLLT